MFKNRLISCLFLGFCWGVSSQAGEAVVLGESHVLHSQHLNEDRPLMVYLPQSYASQPDKRYPVLFSLDGETHFKAVAGVVDWLTRSANAIPEQIVIAIANTPGNRNKDLVALPHQLERNQAFSKFIAEELLPYVDKTWRTQPFRTLSGHSLAGLFTLQMLSERPGLFRGYLVASPYFAIDQGALIAKMADAFKSRPDHFAFVHASLGDEPGLKPLFEKWTKTMTDLAPKSVVWQKQILAGETHMTTPQVTLHAGLQALFADLNLAPNSATMQQGVSAIKAYYQALSKHKYGYQVSAETALNNFGLMTAQKGDLKTAITILADNAKAYPASWKAQLSLSRVLEAGQQWQASLKAATTAEQLAKGEDPAVLQFLKERITRMQNKAANPGD